MVTKMFSRGMKCAIAAAAALALQPALSHADQLGNDTVSVKVSAAGLDLSSTVGAHELYKRLTAAAEHACGYEAEFDALRAAKFDRCYRDTLAHAVSTINRPLLTQAYMEHHSHGEAAPAVVASSRVAGE
jgi:UrcA family protein